MDAPIKTRVERGQELELTVESLAFGGAGVARHEGYVVFVRDAVPGDRVRAVVTKRKKRLRRGAHRRAARRRPGAHRGGRAASGRAVAGAALRAPDRDQGRAGRRRAAAHRPARRLRARADRAGRSSSGATATSSSTRSAPATTARWCAASTRPARGSASSTSRTACWPPSAGNQARRAALQWCRERGPGRLRPPRADRPAAQPRRARGPAHRRSAGAPRHLRRAGRPRRLRRGGRRRQRRVDAGARRRRDHRRRQDRGPARHRGHRGGARRAALPHQRRRLLPDQHGDGRAPLRDRGASTPACRAGSASTTCSAGSARSACRWRRARARSGASRSSRTPIADAIANARRNEIDNVRFFAGDVRLALRELVETAGRPDVLVVDPPRAGLSAKVVRRVIEAGADAHRLRLLQPDDARAQRRAAGRSGLRAAPGAAGRHVPADPAHRVRGAAGARLATCFTESWSDGRCSTSNKADGMPPCAYGHVHSQPRSSPPLPSPAFLLWQAPTDSRSSAGGR